MESPVVAALSEFPGYGWAVLFLILVNFWTLARFWQDKASAVSGERRVPERTLLQLAALGGTPAAYVARRAFRHKTRKQPFSTQLHAIAAAQVAVAAAFLFWR